MNTKRDNMYDMFLDLKAAKKNARRDAQWSAVKKIKEKNAMAENIQYGDLVSLDTRPTRCKGAGLKLGKVVSTGTIRKGVKAGMVEYKIECVDEKTQKVETWTTINKEHLKLATAAQKKTINKQWERIQSITKEIEAKKAERAEENYQAGHSDEMNMLKSVLLNGKLSHSLPQNIKVRIKFSDGVFTKKVVDWNNNGVIIENRRNSIPYTLVMEVIYEELPFPGKISPAEKKSIEKGETILRGISNGEFYVSSLSFGKRPDSVLRKCYECPEPNIYFDSNLKIYWRRAGSFD